MYTKERFASNQSSALTGRLHDYLEAARQRHHVPGAVVGLLRDGETTIATSGVANLRTGTPVTPDMLFPIGSVTKIYSATLLLTLGLDLDDLVRRHLPDFRVADAEATETMTLRHLLTHASGIEGDYVADFGRGADAVQRYVESCASISQVFPPGLLTSYCNTAVVIGGRVVEVTTGMTWDDALRARLLDPAGLTDTVSLPEQAILHPVAVGHLTSENGPVVTSSWSWPHAFGPAGGTPAASAPDILAFTRLHLEGGAGVLPRELVDSMQRVERAWPGSSHAGGANMGLGWQLHDWDGHRVLGHSGSGLGCKALLRAIPDLGAALVILTNYNQGGGPLVQEIERIVFAEELGVQVPGWPAPMPNTIDATRLTGTYGSLITRYRVAADDGALVIRVHQDAVDVHVNESVTEYRPEQVQPDVYVTAPKSGPGTEVAFAFVDTDGDGIADYLYEGSRAHPRV